MACGGNGSGEEAARRGWIVGGVVGERWVEGQRLRVIGGGGGGQQDWRRRLVLIIFGFLFGNAVNS